MLNKRLPCTFLLTAQIIRFSTLPLDLKQLWLEVVDGSNDLFLLTAQIIRFSTLPLDLKQPWPDVVDGSSDSFLLAAQISPC